MSVHPDIFLELDRFFLNFGIGLDKFCLKGPDFSKKRKSQSNEEVGPKTRQNEGFLIYWKIWLLICLFLNLDHNQSLYYLLLSCINPMSGKNLFPETRKNVTSQSDLRILKFTVSIQQNDEIVWFLACSKWKIKFIKIESLLKNFWVGMVKWVWAPWTRGSNIGCI